MILRAIANHMTALVPSDVEILCGLEMGGIPIVTVLGQVTGLPCAFLRKDRKSHGTMKYAEGPSLRNRRTILVEDVVSSGGAIIDGVAMLKEDGIAIDRALCVIDRQTGGREALSASGVTLQSLFTMREIEGDA